MQDLDTLPLPALLSTLAPPRAIERLLANARDEDLGGVGDITTDSVIAAGRRGAAEIVARAEGVVAGLRLVELVIQAFGGGVSAEHHAEDGTVCKAGVLLCRLDGDLRTILRLERTCLNLIGHLSGVATLTRRYVDAVAGTKASILATRKTLPGLRGLQKYAVRCGGGGLHRIGLFDAALYKDNHLAHLSESPGVSLAAAIRAARSRAPLRFVEVEVDTLEQLDVVLGLERGLVDVVLLDNMDPATLRRAVVARDAAAPDVVLEASGGVTLDTVAEIAATGVERISVGALTHSAPALDVAFEIRA